MSQAISLPIRSSALPPSKLQGEPQRALHHRFILWLASRAGAISMDSSRLSRYGTTVAALVAATVVRQLLDPYLQNRAPYGMYLIAVLFVAWRAGLGPSLLTVACGVLLGRYLFEAPRYSLSFDSAINQSSLIMSLTIGVLAAYFCESLRVTARENRRLYDKAREADARKDEFLATLAHELRNPLMPIRMATYLLEETSDGTPRMVELQQMIQRHTEHLVRLVDDLLDVSRITQRKIELRCEPTDLHAAVNAALEVVRPLISEKRQELNIDLPAVAVRLQADGVRLAQIFTNLLHNAAKYTGREGRIWLSAEVQGHDLVFRVRDTGIGLPPAMCERVFDLFQQVQPGVESSQGGLGIGLTIVRELVKLHGGSAEATSPGVGLGSEFTVRLPIVAQSQPVHEKAPAAQAHGIASDSGLRILVVDDSPGVTRSLEMILTEWKHTVKTCGDGFAALEAARHFHPQFVLTDLSMPRMNGYKLAEELRRMPSLQQTVIVAVSGFGQEADRERSQAAGFDRHMTKPVDLAELRQLLLTTRSTAR